MPVNSKFMLAKDGHLGNWTFPKSATGLPPPEEWYWSEKFDGYRAQWTDSEKEFYSRALKIFNAPDWYKLAMPPKEKIDGELWVGRENFQHMGVVRRKEPNAEDWIVVKFMAYDLPDKEIPFSERIKLLKKIVKDNAVRWSIIRKDLPEPFNTIECPLVFAPQTKIKSEEQLMKAYKNVIQCGGEGVMIKQGESLYEGGRSNLMLKLKPSFDEEAIVIDYTEGKGKYKGMLGGFVCQPLINMDTYHVIDKKEGHVFTVSGMDDETRENYKETHPVGTIISITHSGLTDSGKPRFARYMRMRDDVIIKEKADKVSTAKIQLVIKIFKELSEHEKRNGERFKAGAYTKVIKGLKKMNSDIELTEHNIKSIKGVGDSLYKKIDDIKKTGTTSMYENIKDIKDPRKEFMDIHKVGPKKAKELVDAGYGSIEELRKSKDKSSILNNVQLLGLKYYEDLLLRIPYEEIQKHETLLKNVLEKVDKSAELTIAGSYRRKKGDSGDVDVLLTSTCLLYTSPSPRD